MIKLRSLYMLRSACVLLVVALVTIPMSVVSSDEASTSATGGVQVTNVGTLRASIGEGDIGFRTANNSSAGVSSSSGDVMYAQVPITIMDDRADGERDAYSLVLTVSNQTYGANLIEAGSISVTSVDGLPDAGLGVGFNGMTTLSEPVTIVRAVEEPPAGTFNLMVHLRMNVPAGTVPGDYSGTIGLDLQQEQSSWQRSPLVALKSYSLT